MESKRNDILNLVLPNSDIIFTRYLYIKDEVKKALLVSILNKSDDAIFWSYEIFYSGFVKELFILLEKIYYDFFAIVNPDFEVYFYNKKAEFYSEKTNDKIIISIVKNLLDRPFTTDMFFMRNINELYVLDVKKRITDENDNSLKNDIKNFMITKNYRDLVAYILQNIDKCEYVYFYELCIDVFIELGMTINSFVLVKKYIKMKKNITDHYTFLITKILALISKKEGIKTEKKIFSISRDEDIIRFKTLLVNDELKHYRLLENACLHNIDKFKMLGLFSLNRDNYTKKELQFMYYNNWEYHSSFSPIWMSRIRENRGWIDYDKKTVAFINDNCLEQFYFNYGYEPDEQMKTIQINSIGDIEKESGWTNFYNNNNYGRIIELTKEELYELEDEKLIY